MLANTRHTLKPTCIELHEGRYQQFGRERMVLDHLKELVSSRLNRGVGHEHDLHQLGHQVGVADVALVAQHDHEEHHDVLSAGLIQHLRRVSVESTRSLSESSTGREETHNRRGRHQSAWFTAMCTLEPHRFKGNPSVGCTML